MDNGYTQHDCVLVIMLNERSQNKKIVPILWFHLCKTLENANCSTLIASRRAVVHRWWRGSRGRDLRWWLYHYLACMILCTCVQTDYIHAVCCMSVTPWQHSEPIRLAAQLPPLCAIPELWNKRVWVTFGHSSTCFLLVLVPVLP